MAEASSNQPFEQLGNKLKTLRQKLQETVAEVSGAVEVDEEYLRRLETGTIRPSEDILMLLISHFDIADDEAAGLWTLAGYDYDPNKDQSSTETEYITNQGHPMMMVMALDQRIMYSDGAEINANKQGVVISFTQVNGQSTVPISKIGMSYDQAARVLDILQKTLAEAERRKSPKQLPDQTDSRADAS